MEGTRERGRLLPRKWTAGEETNNHRIIKNQSVAEEVDQLLSTELYHSCWSNQSWIQFNQDIIDY